MKSVEEIKMALEYLSITEVTEKVKYARRGLPYAFTDEVAADALALIQQLEVAQLQWISVEDRLPDENEYVLIFADSISVARIIKGISEEERTMMRNGEIENPLVPCWDSSRGHHYISRSELYRSSDMQGNNKVPYSWKANGGPMEWFGQEVSHWMPLPEVPKEE